MNESKNERHSQKKDKGNTQASPVFYGACQRHHRKRKWFKDTLTWNAVGGSPGVQGVREGASHALHGVTTGVCLGGRHAHAGATSWDTSAHPRPPAVNTPPRPPPRDMKLDFGSEARGAGHPVGGGAIRGGCIVYVRGEETPRAPLEALCSLHGRGTSSLEGLKEGVNLPLNLRVRH